MEEPEHHGRDSWLIFLIWPLGALMQAVNHLESKWSRNVIWAFCGYFGFTMVTTSQGADVDRYRSTLAFMHQQHLSLDSLLGMLYSQTTAFVDVVQPFITFAVARFTGDPRILFLVFGLVFGYFYSRNIEYIGSMIETEHRRWSLYLLVLFAFLVPIWEINGFRFWTAAQVFVFGALPYLIERNKASLVWTWLSVFVHFSFIVPAAVLTAYALGGSRLNIYFILFLLSFTISELNLGALRHTLASYAPHFLIPRVNSYFNSRYAEAISTQLLSSNWYAQWYVSAMKYGLDALLTFAFLSRRRLILERDDMTRLLSFTFLFSAFANLASLVPSGGRFLTVSFFFSLGFLLLATQDERVMVRLKPLLALTVPLCLLFVVVTVRIGFDFISYLALIGNPFIAPFIGNGLPLITLIK